MSLFDVADHSADQIIGHLDRAEVYRDKRTADLADVTVASLFFEASTRTRLSFELAAIRLGADVVSFTPESSSVAKGESLKDTVMTVAALGARLLVVRHPRVGSAELVARWTGLPVVNGGDGRKSHPTQTLLDLLTIRRRFGRVEGLDVAIVGDVGNSRVARGLIDARVTLVGPRTLVSSPTPWALRVTNNLDGILAGTDVVYLLRVQRERGGGEGFPDDAGYHRRYGLSVERQAAMKPGAVVMHPGPVNRGVEIAPEVADGGRSLILEQVRNGVPVRMAVLAGAFEAAT